MHDVSSRLIRRERLVAPPQHLGVLIEPGPDAIAAMRRQARPDAPIGDTTIARLRESLRSRLGIASPVIATGHQAELFHAGVFAKNLAASALAQRWNGCAVFLSVDSDLPKSDHLRVTRRSDGGLSVQRVALPGVRTDLPVEAQPAADAGAWADLFASLHDATGANSPLEPYAAGFGDSLRERGSIALAHAGGQAAVDHTVGVAPLRVVRMSELAASPEFAAFVRFWLANARRFAVAYNDALDAYRKRHKLRSTQHPAASLAIMPNAVETPFWRVQRDGRRATLTLRDSDSPHAFDAIEMVRPKALPLSAFARLVLADLFIHGIGGAKYDEVTEDFIRSCFGCEPGAMICVSATVHLHHFAAPTKAELLLADWRVRDFVFNPQQYVQDVPDRLLDRRKGTLARVHAIRAGPRHTRDEWRRLVVPRLAELHRDLRHMTGEIVALAPNRQSELRAEVERLRALAAQARIAADREAFFALHALGELRALADRIREQLFGGVR
ncbi:MAG: hypothetical protein ACKVS9_05510 [Phycisphaerae bacterium]